MPKILIVDDNQSVGTALKLSMQKEHYRVSLADDWHKLVKLVENGSFDLIVINQIRRHSCGWSLFNQLKRVRNEIPAMVYALQDLHQAGIDWIIKAIREVLGTDSPSAPPRYFGRALTKDRSRYPAIAWLSNACGT